ncbi:starch synthase (maltosyl-transferring) [Kitasatospora gansuensis]|uniref:Alpha-1,4-glucan:maltose-1-phosphate maltosyltransferase n=1 Tax=Kitasatospora gansuensis TaxID=258050 RepID=A0A7W7SCG5_9ACTN|nr:maltotransferase domain-containing protein [Kitasatospora gansuensis]MBB4947318.1 starch synthase (maltosyl-transferring) [Kitasatospora gansuensis]
MGGRLSIDEVKPVIGHGEYPAKSVVGEHLPVDATIWREGHDAVGAAVRWCGPGGTSAEIAMTAVDPGTDRWQAVVVPDREGPWTFQVIAWSDPWASWRHAVLAKVEAGQGAEELAAELELGARLLERVARSGRSADRPELTRAAEALRDPRTPVRLRVRAALTDRVERLVAAAAPRDLVTEGPSYQVEVDRERALFSSWYEFFPRSTGGTDAAGRPVHGTFRTAARELTRVAAMGFDVVYLPPVHPIGAVNRKGPNNSLTAGPEDVGSPWAVGSAAGGHDAVHPELGTLADFDAFLFEAGRLGLEVALDLALQCAPDHPWVAEHPEWFTQLPDGSIAFAENPPKKYQDIYPLNFDRAPGGLYREILRVVEFWAERGVRIFRVDNPHTKPPDFWHWLIRTVKSTRPDVLFLAEAFTRPAVLHGLARLGFTQSYTYFTWRDTKEELTDYLTELVGDADFLRPNFFVNTPDILPRGLQRDDPGAFAVRAALAALLSPSWGVYAGFELMEHQVLASGGEEYLDSEKFQLRPRDFAAARAEGRSLEPWLTVLNGIRRRHPALQQLRTLRFHPVDSADLIAFSKTDPATGDTVLCVVTLDPSRPTEGTVTLDPAGPLPGRLLVTDEVTGELRELGTSFDVKVDPDRTVAHIYSWRNS